jgi:hypothetical protein
VTAVALRDRDDQSQVRVDHPLLGGPVSTLDALRQRDLVSRGEQVVAADLGEEAAERVGRDRGGVDREVELEVGLLVVLVWDFNAMLGEDRADMLERLFVEAVLEGERLELCGLDPTALLRVGDQLVERSDVVCRFQRCSPWSRGSVRRVNVEACEGCKRLQPRTIAGAESPF